MDSSPRSVAIVGAGLAGVSAADELRSKGYDGRIHLIGAEPRLPYDRPPLSKQVLTGAWEAHRADLRTEQEYADLKLDLHLGTFATGFRPQDRLLQLSNNPDVHCDGLIIATGMRARRLPGCRVDGVHVLRTLDDAIRLRAQLVSSSRLVVIGAGVLGLEAAASARRLGLVVTVVEAAPAAMTRTLGSELGALICAIHADEGVSVRLGVGVSYFRATSGRLSGVALKDGTILDADVALVAVGAEPNVEWLCGSGVPVGNGVTCDAYLEALPNVFAAGDACEWLHVDYARRLRLEHRNNAAEQGRAAARNLLGLKEQFTAIPYFWTDHYEHKIQVQGLLGGESETLVVEGSLAERRFVAISVTDSRVLGAVSCNMPREFRPYKQLAAQRTQYPIPT